MDETSQADLNAQIDGRPSWMKTLHNSALTWLQLLPKSLQTLKRTVENIKDPLYRYFEREVNSASKLLLDVIHDLNDVLLICQVYLHPNQLQLLIKKPQKNFRAKRSRPTTIEPCWLSQCAVLFQKTGTDTPFPRVAL